MGNIPDEILNQEKFREVYMNTFAEGLAGAVGDAMSGGAVLSEDLRDMLEQTGNNLGSILGIIESPDDQSTAYIRHEKQRSARNLGAVLGLLGVERPEPPEAVTQQPKALFGHGPIARPHR